jgi:hypothetical protein
VKAARFVILRKSSPGWKLVLDEAFPPAAGAFFPSF